MGIRRYLDGIVYEPDLMAAMGKAYERACSELSLTSDKADHATTMVAEIIIHAANDGETDPEKLCEAALRYFQRRTG
jgi:hypothetical protein